MHRNDTTMANEQMFDQAKHVWTLNKDEICVAKHSILPLSRAILFCQISTVQLS